ncbi:ParB N-terminal domain-containing protein [Nonomuraea sp. NPDC050404]|uniref:ParB N-terminal domain-containing protein n=1 Tax=Nonomuraea sp. NPDC050404 TaxID=3155783 RepID=UPI0033E50C89
MEFFQLLGWRWDITAAKKLTQGRTPERRIMTEWWAVMLNLVTIDAEHATQVDLSEPLIVATVPTGGMLIIDGWHRLSKAVTIGLPELSAVVLTAEEEHACRILGGNDDRNEGGEEWPEEEAAGSA